MPQKICVPSVPTRRLDDEQLGAAVVDDPLHLLGRRRLVDGDGHTARGQDGVVGEQPLEPRSRHEGDSAARLEPAGDNALGDGAAAFVELAGGHIDEVVAVPVGGHDPAGFLLGTLDDRFEQIRVWRNRIHNGAGGLAHHHHPFRRGQPTPAHPIVDGLQTTLATWSPADKRRRSLPADILGVVEPGEECTARRRAPTEDGSGPARYRFEMATTRGLTVAVTGPTGTFGSGLVPLLQADKRIARMVGIARHRFDPAEHGWTKMTYQQGDVRDPAALEEAFGGADVVVHLAFWITGAASREATRAVNVDGTINAFRAAAAAGVKRFVYASSVAAYGFHGDNPVGMTEDWPARPATRLFYAQEKAELEHVLQTEAAGSEVQLYLLRPPIVLGPHALGAKEVLPAVLMPLARLAAGVPRDRAERADSCLHGFVVWLLHLAANASAIPVLGCGSRHLVEEPHPAEPAHARHKSVEQR